MNKNIFCSRKGGATIKGKFFPIEAEDFLSRQIERNTKKMEHRQRKRNYRFSFLA